LLGNRRSSIDNTINRCPSVRLSISQTQQQQQVIQYISSAVYSAAVLQLQNTNTIYTILRPERSDRETEPAPGSSPRACTNGSLVDGRGQRSDVRAARRRPTSQLTVSHPANGPNAPLTHSALPLSTTSATTMSPDLPQFPDLPRRTDSLRRLTPARLSHSVGSTRRPCRQAKYSFAPSHTETTPISHGLKLELLSLFDHKSCRPLLTSVSCAVKISSAALFCDFLSQTR